MKKSNIIIVLVSLTVIFIIGILVANGAAGDTTLKTALPPSPAGGSPTLLSEKPTGELTPTIQRGPYPMEIDTTKIYTATLATTVGTIVVELTASKTPITVNNFVALARRNFYNNTVFHRVINGFMIQGGDPNGDGTGGPGYKFNDEPFDGEYTRGTVAMANSGPNSNGSQFFIMHQENPLPKNYVIFGKVVGGMDVVDTIATAPTTANPGNGEQSKPVTSIVITRVDIEPKD